MKDLRRLVATTVIVSFSLAALMGIVALLRGGDFGEAEGRVLLTTVIVGVESVAVLCYLAVARHKLALVGVAGGLVSLVAFGSALVLTWGELDLDDEGLWKTFGVACTIAASLAQACLLLALAGRRKIGAGLAATLLAIGVVATMVVIPILDGSGLSDGYWRAFGVIAILDVLGTVVLTAVGAFGGRRREDDMLSDELEARVRRIAAERGITPSALISEALDQLVAK